MAVNGVFKSALSDLGGIFISPHVIYMSQPQLSRVSQNVTKLLIFTLKFKYFYHQIQIDFQIKLLIYAFIYLQRFVINVTHAINSFHISAYFCKFSLFTYSCSAQGTTERSFYFLINLLIIHRDRSWNIQMFGFLFNEIKYKDKSIIKVFVNW